MKPIKLEMTAFGSFKNHTVIDFSNFEKEVFLITGLSFPALSRQGGNR